MKQNDKTIIPIVVGRCSAHGYEECRKIQRDTFLKYPQEGIKTLFFLGKKTSKKELDSD